MKKVFTFLFLILSFSSFSQKKEKFSLEGKTKDVVDGTVLLMQNKLTNKMIIP